jgi:RHS repeat-associated protein
MARLRVCAPLATHLKSNLTKSLRLGLLLAAVFVSANGQFARGQAAVGVQQFGAYDGAPDTIDLGSLGLRIEIPIYQKAARGDGTGIKIHLSNSTPWPLSGSWPVAVVKDSSGYSHGLYWGLGLSIDLTALGAYSFTSSTHPCVNTYGGDFHTFTDYSWTYVDSSGNSHGFPGNSRSISDGTTTCADHGYTPYGLTAHAADGSGYLLNVSGGSSITNVIDPSGKIFTYGISNSGALVGNLEDANGNFFGTSWGGAPTDSLGNIINYPVNDDVGTTLHISGGGWSPDFSTREPLLITYSNDLGNTQTITIGYKVYKWTTDCCSTVGLMDSITYPDGSQYHFTYVQASYGVLLPTTLASITLPTGGTISYGYPDGTTFGCPVWHLTRTTADGTTTYTHTVTAFYQNITTDCRQQTNSWTQVTKPNGDVTDVYFVVPQTNGWLDQNKTHETKRLEYSHTNLTFPMRTTMRCYNGMIGDCTTTTFSEPVSQLSVLTTLDNFLTSKVVTMYTAAGLLPSEVDEYDFGATTPTRKTVTQYASLTNNISNKPATVIIYDSAGNIAKKTTYAYDETTPPPMTLPGHTTIASGARGNPTTVTAQVNSSGATVTTKYAYDDAGQVTSVTDPNGNVTTYGYDAATDAYRTKITRPKTGTASHISTFGYGPNSGLVTSAYDENNQLASYVYDAMYRPSSITYPDGGQDTFSYSTSPTSKTTNVLQQSGTWITSLEQLDGYGRPSQAQLTTDPQGTDYTVTTYDSLGRKSSVYNPTRCNPPTANCGETTWGITTYTYDALNRTTAAAVPDASVTSTVYDLSKTDSLGRASSCTTATDEAGNARESCVDGLGRLTSVWEAPSSLNYETDYTYDALNNLTSVTQKGGSTNSANWRTRTFQYNFLGLLTSASNPESGVVAYAYDGNGNLITKTAPKPNQTGSATVTTTYNYDALNRLTKRSYNDNSTPTAQFGYDGVALTGCTKNPPAIVADSAPIGNSTSMCDGSGATSWSHDKMGRVVQEGRFIGAMTPAKLINYGYNLDGSLQYLTTPPLKTIVYTYNGAGRATKGIDSIDNINFATGATYSPGGALTAMTMGPAAGFAGIVTSNAFNNRLQPILLSAGVAGQNPVFSECFDFHLGVAVNTAPCSFGASNPKNDNGNVYQIVNNRDTTRSQSFTYDALNRIYTGQSSGTQWGEAFTIDAWGNLTNEAPVANKTSHEGLSASAGTNNQLAGFGYDAPGNMTSNGSTSYVYDAENRLTWTSGYKYVYDGNGERVEKCVAATSTTACPTSGANGTLYWKGTGSDTLDESDLSGNPQEEYVFFNGQRIARRDVTATGATIAVHYYFSDHLGSHGVVENATASACEQDIDYYPYGGVEHDYCATQVPQHYKFTGQERDAESGLDYFEARHFTSSLGRFMVPDPAGILAADPAAPQSWNLYAYVLNNPLNAIDPFGLWCVWEDGSHDDGPEDGGTKEKDCVDQGGHWDQYDTITGIFQQNGVVTQINYTVNGVNYSCTTGDCGVGGTLEQFDQTLNTYNQMAANDSWAWAFTMSFFTFAGGPGNKPTCAGQTLRDIRDELTGDFFKAQAAEQTLKTAGTAQAARAMKYAASRPNSLGGTGLICARCSSVFRSMIGKAEFLGEASEALPVLEAGYAAGKSIPGVSAQARNGECAAALPVF